MEFSSHMVMLTTKEKLLEVQRFGEWRWQERCLIVKGFGWSLVSWMQLMWIFAKNARARVG